MIIKKPLPFDVFTGGYFGRTGTKNSISVFTGGQFSGTTILILNQETSFIDFAVNKIHTIIPYVTKTVVIDFITKPHSVTISSAKMNIDYNKFSKLPNGWMTKCSSSYQTERDLFANLQMEKYNKFGINTTYYRLEYDLVNSKPLGEDDNAIITTHWDDVMVDYKTMRESKMWQMPGIEYAESFDMYISKKHFDYMSSGTIPQTGDIIHVHYTNMLYEILDKNEEKSSLFLSKMYNWELTVKPLSKKRMYSFADSQIGTYLYDIVKKRDVLDVTGVVETKIDSVKYKPKNTEQSIRNPYAGY